MNWQYNSKHYNEENLNLINPGNYKVKISSARETVAKNGNEGIEIIFEVNGYVKKLKYFIWYNRDFVARTNQLLGEFFESFSIIDNERNDCNYWVGKQGAVNVVHDEYKGHTIAKVAFCIKREFQNKLEAWKDYKFESNSNLISKVDNISSRSIPVSETFNGFNF